MLSIQSRAVVENISDKTALLALQGPLAQKVLEKTMVGVNLDLLKPFGIAIANVFGIECVISRTGYTGEDGFELFFDSSKMDIWNRSCSQVPDLTSNRTAWVPEIRSDWRLV